LGSLVWRLITLSEKPGWWPCIRWPVVRDSLCTMCTRVSVNNPLMLTMHRTHPDGVLRTLLARSRALQTSCQLIALFGGKQHSSVGCRCVLSLPSHYQATSPSYW